MLRILAAILVLMAGLVTMFLDSPAPLAELEATYSRLPEGDSRAAPNHSPGQQADDFLDGRRRDSAPPDLSGLSQRVGELFVAARSATRDLWHPVPPPPPPRPQQQDQHAEQSPEQPRQQEKHEQQQEQQPREKAAPQPELVKLWRPLTRPFLALDGDALRLTLVYHDSAEPTSLVVAKRPLAPFMKRPGGEVDGDWNVELTVGLPGPADAEAVAGRWVAVAGRVVSETDPASVRVWVALVGPTVVADIVWTFLPGTDPVSALAVLPDSQCVVFARENDFVVFRTLCLVDGSRLVSPDVHDAEGYPVGLGTGPRLTGRRFLPFSRAAALSGVECVEPGGSPCLVAAYRRLYARSANGTCRDVDSRTKLCLDPDTGEVFDGYVYKLREPQWLRRLRELGSQFGHGEEEDEGEEEGEAETGVEADDEDDAAERRRRPDEEGEGARDGHRRDHLAADSRGAGDADSGEGGDGTRREGGSWGAWYVPEGKRHKVLFPAMRVPPPRQRLAPELVTALSADRRHMAFARAPYLASFETGQQVTPIEIKFLGKDTEFSAAALDADGTVLTIADSDQSVLVLVRTDRVPGVVPSPDATIWTVATEFGVPHPVRNRRVRALALYRHNVVRGPDTLPLEELHMFALLDDCVVIRVALDAEALGTAGFDDDELDRLDTLLLGVSDSLLALLILAATLLYLRWQPLRDLQARQQQ